MTIPKYRDFKLKTRFRGFFAAPLQHSNAVQREDTFDFRESSMDPRTLNTAIRRLQDAHDIGRELGETIELGAGGKQARDGQLTQAIKGIKKRWRGKLSGELARKMISFSKRYTDNQLQTLFQQCRKHGHALEFGLVIRLLSVEDNRVRNKLQLRAIRNKWSKQILEAELRRQKPKAELLDTKRRGRKPQAVSSREALLGAVSSDAVKWVRILNHFEQDSSVWNLLSKAQKRDIEDLVRILKKIAASGS